MGTYVPLTLLAPIDAATISVEQPVVVTVPEAVAVALPAGGSSAVSLTGAEEFAGFTAENDAASVPLVLDGSIEGPDGWWRLTHPGELLG